MKKISYCTTCKGRLWQLHQTLPVNIKLTSVDVDIVLLDYHSDDGLEDYIKTNYGKELTDGRLKYFKLETTLEGFDMAYAKHIVHLLSEGNKVFNLDADNYIGTTIPEMTQLPLGKLLLPRLVKGTHTARCGRIGMYRADYISAGGYDINIIGMKNDDGDVVHRAWLHGLRFVFSDDVSEPIEQTVTEKFMHIREGEYTLPGTVIVQDHNDVRYDVDLLKQSVRRNVEEIE